MTATATAFAPAVNAGLAPDALQLRPAEARGRADFGWLDSRHSFSFGQYYDPRFQGFSNLRVINDDRVAPGGGFPMHSHQDAEIFSYILDGALAHKDSMGHGSTVKAGGVQYMAAGSGVSHSEFNANKDAPVRFLQVWLIPQVRGAAPRYDTLDLDPAMMDGRPVLFLSPDGRNGSIPTNADANVHAARLDGSQAFDFELPEGRVGWVQVARGTLKVNDGELREGDGLAVTQPGTLSFTDGEEAEVLIFDLPS